MTAKMALIVAIGENGVIGADGDMPWKLSSDLKWFKKMTLGKPVVMGRKTLQSIGRPLPGRENLIVSRDPAYRPDGVTVFSDLEAAIASARQRAADNGVDEFIIGGGGQIYAATIEHADRLYVTHVAARPAGDTVFPLIDPDVWQMTQEEIMPRGEKDSAEAIWRIYERRASRTG